MFYGIGPMYASYIGLSVFKLPIYGGLYFGRSHFTNTIWFCLTVLTVVSLLPFVPLGTAIAVLLSQLGL